MNGSGDAIHPDQMRAGLSAWPRARRRVAAVGLCLAAVFASGAAFPTRAQDVTAGYETAYEVADEIARFGQLMLAQPFPYEARDVPVTDVLRQMTQRSGVPMIVDEGVSGRVDVDNAGGSLRDVLDMLAEGGHAVWWFDGAAVHVEPAGTVVSRLLPLQGVELDDLRSQMRALQFDDSSWPLIAGGDARVVRVVGPRGYADAVAELISAMAAELAPTAQPRLPVVIRGPGRRRGGWTYAPPSAGAQMQMQMQMPTPVDPRVAVPAAPIPVQ